MSVETAEKDSASEAEVWVQMSKMLALVIRRLPKDERADFIEVLAAMADSDEDMEDGVETLREFLSPKSGRLISMDPSAQRPVELQKWADYAGGRIRLLRKEADMTQEALSEKTGIPQSHISRIENGEVSPNRFTLEKIAAALAKPLNEFDPSA